jgi:hypothetical protein
MRECACGKCGVKFEAKSGRKYAQDCPNRKSKPRSKPKSKSSGAPASGRRRMWIPELAMWIVVDPAVDHYETRGLSV